MNERARGAAQKRRMNERTSIVMSRRMKQGGGRRQHAGGASKQEQTKGTERNRRNKCRVARKRSNNAASIAGTRKYRNKQVSERAMHRDAQTYRSERTRRVVKM
jgi:hypothetical protein